MWPIKDFEKYFMAHQYLPKIFHDPHKNLPAPHPTSYGPLWSRINIFAKNSILGVEQGSEYGYELLSHFTRFYAFLFIHSETICCSEKCFLLNKYIYVRCIVRQSFFLVPVLKCNRALLMQFNQSRLCVLGRLFVWVSYTQFWRRRQIFCERRQL